MTHSTHTKHITQQTTHTLSETQLLSVRFKKLDSSSLPPTPVGSALSAPSSLYPQFYYRKLASPLSTADLSPGTQLAPTARGFPF